MTLPYITSKLIEMESNKSKIMEWNPVQFLDINRKCDHNYAIIILNRPILLEQNLIIHLWNEATARITVDGGTNHWLSFINSNKNIYTKPPDYVSGDFDSITGESMEHAKMFDAEIISTPDQNETDFTKALRILTPTVEREQIASIIVIVETSGRIDQIMGNINSLFKANEFIPKTNIYLLASNSISWLLSGGKHKIIIPKFIVDNKTWCSLVPIGESAVVSTSGLKWNLDKHEIKFGGIVSTSNTYGDKCNFVEIQTNRIILWSMGLPRNQYR